MEPKNDGFQGRNLQTSRGLSIFRGENVSFREGSVILIWKLILISMLPVLEKSSDQMGPWDFFRGK